MEDKTTGRLSLILASRNAGKAREFERLLGEAFSVSPTPPEVEMPEETGETFAENARLKAEGVFTALGSAFAVLADDSGLEVSALEGEPGVRSARYAGVRATDEENVAKLLRELDGAADRSARFVCDLCLILPFASAGDPDCDDPGDSVVFEVERVVEGVIEPEPRGTDGFGYDPVFRPKDWSETLAEASPAKKDEISHRGAAARELVRQLAAEEWIAGGD